LHAKKEELDETVAFRIHAPESVFVLLLLEVTQLQFFKGKQYMYKAGTHQWRDSRIQIVLTGLIFRCLEIFQFP